MLCFMADSKRDANEKAEREKLDKELDSAILAKVQDEQNEMSERRLIGTGDWVKREPLFQEWIAEQAPILWILGRPGAGKSFLSSRIISYLEELHPQDPQDPSRVSIAYFYIKEDDHQLRSVNTMFKSVALQIAFNDPVYRKHAANVCSSRDKISTASRTWKTLFLDFFNSQQNRGSAAFIVIDGLDEAPKVEQDVLIKILRDLEKDPSHANGDQPRMHFTIVGRPELRQSISSIWDSHIIYIEVSAKKNTADIDDYIKRGIHKVKALKNKHTPDRDGLRSTIVEKLTEGAMGMFLWVNLMLDQICNVSRPSVIEGILEEAPHDLAQMIRHVFERLAVDPSVQKEDINEMLVWVTFAHRRLVLGEMDIILKLRPPIGEGMPDLEDRLRGQFASVFTLYRDDGRTTEDLALGLREKRNDKLLHEDDGTADDANSIEADESDDDEFQIYDSDLKTTLLEFSHASIRDYLIQEGKEETRKWPADLGIGVEIGKGQHHITAVCLSILCDKEHKNIFPENNLLEYAADNFLTHLQRLDKSSFTRSEKRVIVEPLFKLFHDEFFVERWANLVSSWWSTFIPGWLNDRSISKCVREWLADEDVEHFDFTPDQILQLRSASGSDMQLFELFATLCKDLWLTPKGDDLDPECYVWFLHIYFTLVSDFHFSYGI